MENTETLEEMPEHEAAFVRAKAGFELFGNPLFKYSASRKVAAQAMGLLYPFVGEGGSRQIESTGLYPGCTKDTIIVLWLCSIKDTIDLSKEEVKARAWSPSRAVISPPAALEAAMEWGEQVGICDSSDAKFLEAYQTFMAIVTGVEASKFRVVLDGQEEEPTQDSNQLGLSDSIPNV